VASRLFPLPSPGVSPLIPLCSPSHCDPARPLPDLSRLLAVPPPCASARSVIFRWARRSFPVRRAAPLPLPHDRVRTRPMATPFKRPPPLISATRPSSLSPSAPPVSLLVSCIGSVRPSRFVPLLTFLLRVYFIYIPVVYFPVTTSYFSYTHLSSDPYTHLSSDPYSVLLVN
jgi:hypothetical protein